jgi:thiamine kinase-like enzyme
VGTFLSGADDASPSWLTAVLRQSGVLRQGAVIAIERETTGTFNSRTSRLTVRYTDDAPPGMPARLILKRNAPAAWAVEAGAKEVAFYDLVASLPDHPPIIPPRYAAAYDASSGDSYLLLHDLSATHLPPLTRDQQIGIVDGVPHATQIASVIDTLARLHAYWWEHPLLDADLFSAESWFHTAERFAQYLSRRIVAWRHLIATEEGWFPDDLRILYERVLERLRHHWERYLEPRFRTRTNLTLVHGDAYFANFLCPKVPIAGATYLLDWQSPGCDIGGLDLANLCATFWNSTQRHEGGREEMVLRQYHAALHTYGVQRYSWDDLLTDYRIGLIYWLLVPVQDCYGGSSKEYWWPKMQCLVAAFREWGCERLLETEVHES